MGQGDGISLIPSNNELIIASKAYKLIYYEIMQDSHEESYYKMLLKGVKEDAHMKKMTIFKNS